MKNMPTPLKTATALTCSRFSPKCERLKTAEGHGMTIVALYDITFYTMEKQSIAIEFSHENINYVGWATPSDRHHADGKPSSYHVVLNENFFGDMSFKDGHWLISEQRPADLVKATGEALKNVIL